MKIRFQIACTALLASAALFISNSARADGWRCNGSPDCQDALLNDIESLVEMNWPSQLSLSVPSLPYTCTRQPGSGHMSVNDSFNDTEGCAAGVAPLSWSGQAIDYVFSTSTSTVGTTGVADLDSITSTTKSGRSARTV